MEIVTIPIRELRPDPKNPRSHDEQNLTVIEQSLARYGQVEPIVAQAGTRRIVAGHGRVEAMKRLGWEDCQVVELEIDDRTAASLAIMLNRSGELAGWNKDLLGELLSDLKEADDLLGTGFSDADVDQLLRDLEAANASPLEDPGAQTPPAAAVTRPGDLWLLDKHRLGCGDATSRADVERVLAGAVPFAMLTDPPYGVAYSPEWRNEAGLSETKRTGKVTNDERVDWSEAFALFPGDVAYVWHAGKFAAEVAQSLAKTGFEIRAQLIWSKPRFAISRGHYHWQHEPAYYSVREGRTSKWCGDRTQSTVWEVDAARDVDQTEHGTPKPLELFLRPMRNHGGPDDDIYDPFAGTGTAIIAAEQLHRRCFALEIEPRYCDAIVKRWQLATKRDAVLEGSGQTFAQIESERSS